jgi:hypothetical protein
MRCVILMIPVAAQEICTSVFEDTVDKLFKYDYCPSMRITTEPPRGKKSKRTYKCGVSL